MENADAPTSALPATGESVSVEELKTWSVLVIDWFHMEPEDDLVIRGFSTEEAAIEFARRWTRDSFEEQGRSQSAWRAYGDSALVIGGSYSGSDEIDFFEANPATPEERDFNAVRRACGMKH